MTRKEKTSEIQGPQKFNITAFSEEKLGEGQVSHTLSYVTFTPCCQKSLKHFKKMNVTVLLVL